MPGRRETLKPSEYTRCTKCNRLLEKRKANRIDGFDYGPECATKVLNSRSDDAAVVPGD